MLCRILFVNEHSRPPSHALSARPDRSFANDRAGHRLLAPLVEEPWTSDFGWAFATARSPVIAGPWSSHFLSPAHLLGTNRLQTERTEAAHRGTQMGPPRGTIARASGR